jgi:D-tyrosyl-tRNA(Tyr) deacylase
MRVLLQRVSSAQVTTESGTTGSIGTGLLVFLAVAKEDTEAEADYLLRKIAELRVFPDGDGKLNLNLREAGGSLLIVSQFTLYADCSRGRRPGFERAAPPQQANILYEYFISAARLSQLPVQTGESQATMKVSLVNEGPVTIWLDTAELRTSPRPK